MVRPKSALILGLAFAAGIILTAGPMAILWRADVNRAVQEDGQQIANLMAQLVDAGIAPDPGYRRAAKPVHSAAVR